MSTPVVATGAAALGFYVWLRRWQQCGYAGVADLPAPLETHARTEQPPTTWSETLYLFKEALRYMYQETFGRWHAIDLFFGLAYLSRRPTGEYPAADIAAAGRPLHDEHTQPQAAQDLIQELLEVKKYMLYCQGLKHHKPELQIKHWRITTGLEPEDIISHSPIAGLLRPAYVIFLDRASHKIIVCVRGTHSRSDMFTSLTGTVKPHHMVTPQGVALGYSHLGMLAAARWLLNQTKGTLIQALEQHPGYQLRIVGHSMGGGTAAMLTMMMREKVPELSHATAWAIACPACMTLDLAASCAPFVTSLVHGADIVPTFSSGALDRLRDEVTQSSWFAEFQGDVRQRLTANFGASVRALSLTTAGKWTQRNIIHTAATSFRSCYNRAPRSWYTRAPRTPGPVGTSDEHASPPVSPHAAAAPQHRSTWGFQILSSRHARQQPAHAVAGDSSGDGGRASLQPAEHDGSLNRHQAVSAADSESAALLGHGQHASPFQWLKATGGRGRRPGYAAAAVSRGGSFTAGDVHRINDPAGSEVALVEHALQACLRAADSGTLEEQQLASGAAIGKRGPGVAVPAGAMPAAAFAAAGGGTAAGRGAGLASSLVQAATKVVLRTKRPAAPSKKDDDEVLQPPLQQSRPDAVWQPVAQQVPASIAATEAAVSPLPYQQLPLSTLPRAPGPGSAAAAAVATAAESSEAATMGTSWDTGGDGSSADPATAASSGSKPHPTSLRSRKGWAWGSMLSGGPGDHGWVSDDGSSRRSSLAGGRRVVEYLGQTVGQTGRLMVQTTGHLLKNSNALFTACAAPVQHPSAVGAASAMAVAPGAPKQHQQDAVHAQAGQSFTGVQQDVQAAAGDGRSGIVTAPSSSGMDRDAADGPFGAALAARLAEEDSELSDSDSESDPDLQVGMDEEASFNPLDQPALRGNISALVAAVSSDATAAGQSAARVQQEEDRAAEKLLHDMGSSASESNIQRLAQQHNAAAAAATGRNATQSLQQQAANAVVGNSLRRDSPMCPPNSAEPNSRPAGGSSDGGSSGDGSSSNRDKAAERLARRRMYPVGRILHLMPRLACPVPPPGPDAAADADSTSRAEPLAGEGGGGVSSSTTTSRLPPLTAALGSVGLGDDYVLLEVERADVYGRVKLCPAMVRDHFIPSYLRALDNVLGQLQHAAARSGAVLPCQQQAAPQQQMVGDVRDGRQHVPGVASGLRTGVSAGLV